MELDSKTTSIFESNLKIYYATSFVTLAAIILVFYVSYIFYLKRKPLGHQTILDLIHGDLAYCYAVSCISFCICFSLIISIPIPWNHYIAIITSWLVLNRFYALWLAVMIAMIIRYIHIYHPWTLENMELTDESIRKFLYYSILMVSSSLSAIVTWGYNSNL